MFKIGDKVTQKVNEAPYTGVFGEVGVISYFNGPLIEVKFSQWEETWPFFEGELTHV